MSQEQNTTLVVFSKQLNRLMKEKDVTQSELGRVMGVSQAAVSKWLKGTIPKGDQLYVLAEFFGIGMDEFIAGKKITPVDGDWTHLKTPDDRKKAFALIEDYKTSMDQAAKLRKQAKEMRDFAEEADEKANKLESAACSALLMIKAAADLEKAENRLKGVLKKI